MSNISELETKEAVILPFKPKVKNTKTSHQTETGLGGLFFSFSSNSNYMKIYADALLLTDSRQSFQNNLSNTWQKQSLFARFLNSYLDVKNRSIQLNNKNKIESYFKLFIFGSLLTLLGALFLSLLSIIITAISHIGGFSLYKSPFDSNPSQSITQLIFFSGWIVSFAMVYSYVEIQKEFSKEILDDSQRIHRWLYQSSLNQDINLLELFKSTVNELNYKPSKDYIDRLEKRYPNANWNLQQFVQGFSHHHLYDTMDSDYDSEYGHIFECMEFMSRTEFEVSNFLYHVACNKNLAQVAITSIH